ncbi:hypothetical protein AURDEDRAFT_178528 [Auricularia subglabra TFB-10046 SS5]|uniref:Uncharacterized protein n=1 Tax=Auricularia subglabra (strain TFB-10046 / SS5) TaxID=717982 RepID=J0CQC0_AURST|nr:hypothetical protein AURDEDRAFT_178528 [Auricularia subglabra TFB-10046 SS5]
MSKAWELRLQSADTPFAAFHRAFARAWVDYLPQAQSQLPHLRLFCCSELKIAILSYMVWVKISHSPVQDICVMVARTDDSRIIPELFDNASGLVLSAARRYVSGLGPIERAEAESRAERTYTYYSKRVRTPATDKECAPSKSTKPTVESLLKFDYFVCCNVTTETATRDAFNHLWNCIIEDKLQVQIYRDRVESLTIVNI